MINFHFEIAVFFIKKCRFHRQLSQNGPFLLIAKRTNSNVVICSITIVLNYLFSKTAFFRSTECYAIMLLLFLLLINVVINRSETFYFPRKRAKRFITVFLSIRFGFSDIRAQNNNIILRVIVYLSLRNAHINL